MRFRPGGTGPLLYRGGPVRREGLIVGRLASGACGSHLGAAEVLGAAYEIEVAGEKVAAEASLKPMHDPTGERVRG